MGQIERQRRHRYQPVGERGEVGARFRLHAGAFKGDPVIGKSASVGALFHAQPVGNAPPLSGENRAGDGVGLTVGKVDVDHRAVGNAAFQELGYDHRPVRFGRRPGRPVARVVTEGLRQGDRRNAEQRALHGAGDGTGIGDVVGDVLAAIDARKDQVGALVHDHLQSHDDAVGRRAAHRPAALAGAAQPERIRQCQRMGNGGLVGFRRHHPQVVGELAGDPHRHVETRRMDAVIIGDQDAHAQPIRCVPPI